MGCLNLQVIGIDNNSINVKAENTDFQSTVDAFGWYDYIVRIAGSCDVILNASRIRNQLNVVADKQNSASVLAGLVCTTNLSIEDGVLWVKEGIFLTLSNGRIILNYE